MSQNSNFRGMAIGQAVTTLGIGHPVCRRGWNGKNQRIVMQKPDENSKMTEPYIYMEYKVFSTDAPTEIKRIPWLCSQADLLGTDWEIARW